jgi:hypothetical protein
VERQGEIRLQEAGVGPSSSIARAPATILGRWATKTIVPDQRRTATSSRRADEAGHVRRARTRTAGRGPRGPDDRGAGVKTPVVPFSGSASMSVRTSTVGPCPLRNTPTTPIRPTFSVTSMPTPQLLRDRRGVRLHERQLGMRMEVLVDGELG